MKVDEKGVIGDSIRGEGGGEDLLWYFNRKVACTCSDHDSSQSTALKTPKTRPMMSHVLLFAIVRDTCGGL